jgi:(E)-4-hydroxy-3-methylbut-2-enyl-diphosphate synthase
MTNTDTADVASTVKQVAELWRAGSELVRITVNNAESAAAVPRIVDKLAMMGITVPLIGDFHYNGHTLLANEPACAEALAKYRINPGNVGFGKKKRHPVRPADRVRDRVRQAGAHRRQLGLAGPVAGGAADGRERAARRALGCRRAVMREALIRSALDSAQRAERSACRASASC